ncbi:MAG TPA: class I SAM-dependent methyltransferase [Rubrobacter sp.]|nr:class I SAM-dependent methyltransferase [Rubrobacter sp.]
MIKRDLLSIVRLSDNGGLVYAGGIEEDGMILTGEARSPATGDTYKIKNGYLDLLSARTGADNVANLTNFLPGAGRGYEPLWRKRSLSLLTGELFPNEREIEIVTSLVRPVRGGRYLDLGCSSGLYTRSLASELGDAVGIDISPSMLREAARRSRRSGAKPSFIRASAASLPFIDASFAGAVCGGSLNEFGDPARVMRETRRILEPGGRLAIMGILRASTPGGHRLQRLLSRGGLKFFDPDEVHSLLDHAGFEPDTVQTHGPVFFAGATSRT